MTRGDFDIDALAEYLHLQPQQVGRMADRGTLPGRRVGGQWRFSQDEVHHWLEERIGASGEKELLRMEGALERQAAPEDIQPEIASLLRPEAIAIPLEAKTRDSVITTMAKLAAATGLLWDPESMAEAVRVREQMQSTAMDNGVALLHPRRPQAAILAEPLLAYGRTWQGIPFGGDRGALTDIFILVCSMDDRGHLRTLARLGRILGDPAFLASLREVDSPPAVHELFAHREQELTERA